MCEVKLTDVPKQQYSISRIQNKVYDITERKKFCSNKCYKSSVYLKEQILTTPLWVRKEDDVIPDFKLLSLDEQHTENVEKCIETDDPAKNQTVNENIVENDEDEENSVEAREWIIIM